MRFTIGTWSVLVALAFTTSGCRNADPGITPAGVGAQCSGDQGCNLGLTCQSVAGFFDFGAICTRSCRIDDDCPSGTRCAPSGATAAGWTFSCLRACDRTADVDVACAGSPATFACLFDGVCTVFRCDDVTCDSGHCDARTGDCITGANPSAHVDDACTTDADCRPPRGTCFAGHCSEDDCDRGGAYACAAGETCVGSSIDDHADVLTFACARSCTVGVDATGPHAGGACLDGQICVPHDADPGGLSTTGHCEWFNDHTFVSGNPAAHVGDRCTRNDDCPSPFGYGLCDGGTCAMRFCNTTAFEGMSDPCGPNERCVTVMLPSATTRWLETVVHTGACLRGCDAGTACPSGMVCNTGGGYCQLDCRLDPTTCPASTACRTDGTCS